jgi:tRNA pseudouridine55 synthase
MDGIIIINKPKKSTSHDVVYKVKKMFNEKVGHTGTLDPNATGVLPILVGKGTLISKYLINHDKIYEVTLKLGIKTDTADIEGNILEEKEVASGALDCKVVKEILNQFKGKQMQIPPMYSAIKVNGKKLYEYARKGKDVKVEPRQIEIYDIALNNIDVENKEILYTVHCSKGTYIRSLCEDIADRLGTIGFMKELNRVKVGEFSIQDAISLEKLEENKNNEEFVNENFITIEDLFKKNTAIKLESKKLQLFLNGVMLSVNLADDVYRIYSSENFIGIGVVKNNLLKRDVII